MKPTSPSPETLRLAAGAVHLRWTRAGSRLVLQHGRLVVETAPRWLGERVVRMRSTVQAGSAWRAERSGWVAFSALEAAGGELHAPPALPARLERAVAQGLARLADRLDAAARTLRRYAGGTSSGTMRAPHLPQSA